MTGQYANQLAVTSTFTDATLQAAGVTTITDGIGNKFIPETNYNGSTFAKWVSNLFLFEDPCDGIEMKLSAVFYETDSIKDYYKPRNVGFEGNCLTSTGFLSTVPDRQTTSRRLRLVPLRRSTPTTSPSLTSVS